MFRYPWEEDPEPVDRKTQDLVATWPKAQNGVPRKLDSYRSELAKAEEAGQLINFKVSHFPAEPGFLDWGGRPKRLYMIYCNFVVGYNEIVEFREYEDGVVQDPITGDFWPAGKYIVRDPKWYPVNRMQKSSGRGWQYFTYIDRKAQREAVAAA